MASCPPNTDVLVVGGGVHGVGVAQAAAAAGHDVVLIERTALAAGTSSKSSKLIHGGLRYLEQGSLKLVRESLRERELLLRLAPELVKPRKFFLPIYTYTTRKAWQIRLGLGLYGALAGFGPHARFRSIPKRDWTKLDGLKTDDLRYVFQYWDAQTDDRQLTRAVMRSAIDLGAILCCPAELQGARLTERGVTAEIVCDGRNLECTARALVLATGAWTNHLHQRFTPALPSVPVDLVGGTHLELPGRVELGCYYLEAPADQRAVFVMPWKDRTLLGTTECPFAGDPSSLAATPAECQYLLETLQHYFPDRDQEVLDAWAGLRVLPRVGASAFSRSRETMFAKDRQGHPRVISIFGGKLTGYRLTGEKTVRMLRNSLPDRPRRARTDMLTLSPI